MKALRKLGRKGIQMNVIKAIYDKLIVNLIHNREKLRQFGLQSGTR
jgi:hypothetical protein